MEKYLISGQKLIDIADAIREKTETSEPIVVSQMDEAIRAIQVGVDTSDATAAAGDILSGKTAYVNEQKITGTMANNGAVSATLGLGDVYTIPNGFHSGSGTVTASSLPTLTNPAGAENIDSGFQAIDGDGNLIAGTSIKVDTSDANATAAQILSGKTAYVKGSKVTGTLVQKNFTFGQIGGNNNNPLFSSITIPNLGNQNFVAFVDSQGVDWGYNSSYVSVCGRVNGKKFLITGNSILGNDYVTISGNTVTLYQNSYYFAAYAGQYIDYIVWS